MGEERLFNNIKILFGIIIIILLSGCLASPLEDAENQTTTESPATTTTIELPTTTSIPPDNSEENLKLIDAYVIYDHDYTKAVDNGEGYVEEQ